MKLQRLEDLYIRQLELIFSPPGLPLVAKADPKGAPTTTILIRGEAGAGKTTLALALAHAIARARKGVLLVLNTETAPVEVDAKAAVLGISSRQVLAWPARSKARKGSIVVQHIALAAGPDEQDLEGEPAPRPGLLDALWEMLRVYRDESPDRPPIVAVMIDGMLLTERDESTGPTRSDTAAFLQALETRGISTVMIEESAPKQTSWLPFVVDLVFELQFNIADDTRKLVRQLVCRKSRYAPAFAGPHEYDLDEDDVLAVWPDPLDIDSEILREISGTDDPGPSIFWPLNEENTCWIWNGAGLLSAPVSEGWDIVQALAAEPYTMPIELNLDEQGMAWSEHSVQPHNRGGIYSIVWDLLRAAQEQGKSVIVLHELDRLLARSQSPALFHRAIRALLRSGFLIGVRGKEGELDKVQPFASFSQGSFKVVGERKMRKHENRYVERWFVNSPPIRALTPDERADLSQVLAQHPRLRALTGWLNEAGAASSTADIDQHVRTLLELAKLKPEEDLSPSLSLLAFECLQRLDRLGGDLNEHLPLLARVDDHDPRVSTQRALFWYLTGDDWRAAHSWQLSNGLNGLSDRIIWATLCARHAGTEIARSSLQRFTVDPSNSLNLRRLAASSRARLHMIRGEAAEAREIIHGVSSGLEPWLVERWHAEVALESTDDAILAPAVQTLDALTIDQRLSTVHQAEICFNLAILAERRGDPATALTACNHAIERNSALEPTILRLRSRLRATPSIVPT